MRIRLPWPLRRSPEHTPLEGEVASEGDGAGPAGPGIDVDPAFASGFRARAHRRDAMPILGPWGGLGETARFAVAATRFQGTLLTQRWSDQIVRSSDRLARDDSPDFIASLASLASYTDPWGAPGDSGSPFADSLPVTGGAGTFVSVGAAPAVPAFPALSGARPALPRPLAPVARSTARPAPAQTRPASPGPAPRRAEPSGRIRSVVSELTSPPSGPPVQLSASGGDAPLAPPPSPDLMRDSPAPAVVDDLAPGGAAREASPLTLAGRAVEAAPSTEAPASLAARAPGTPAGRAGTSGATPEPVASIAPASDAASTPAPASRAPAGSEQAEAATLLDDSGVNDETPLVGLEPRVDSTEAARTDDLTLAAVAEGTVGQPQPAVAAAPGGSGRGAAPSDDTADEAPAPLVGGEVPPPLSLAESDAGGAMGPAPTAQPALVRRFTVGEPLAVPVPGDSPGVTAKVARGTASPSPSGPGVAAGDLPVSAAARRGLTSTPIARVPGGVGPSAGGASQAAGSTIARAASASPRGPETQGSAGESRGAPASARTGLPLPLHTADAVQGLVSVPAAATPLFEQPGAPPLELEAPPPATVRRAPGSSAAPAEASLRAVPPAPSSSAGSPPPVAALPLARPEAWPAAVATVGGEGRSTPSNTGGGIPASSSLPRNPMPVAPGGRAPAAVQRAADGAAAEAPADGGATAVGEIRATEDPAKADQDLDKLTEKVWQRIRRTLQLERERRRGLP